MAIQAGMQAATPKDLLTAAPPDAGVSPHRPGTAPGRTERPALDDAAAYLASASDVPIDLHRARAVAREAEALGLPWLDALARVCTAIGLGATTLSLSARALTASEQHRALPFVCVGPAGPFAVTGHAGPRVVVHPLVPGGASRTLGAVELAAMMGAADPDAPAEWLVAAPVTPLDPISSATLRATPGRDDHHGDHPSPLARLRALLRTERDDLWVVLIYAIAVGLLSLATPVAVQALVNSVAFGALLQPIVVLTVIVSAVLGFAALLRALQVRVVEAIQRRLFVRVALDLAHRLPRVDVRGLDGRYGPELVNRFFDVLTVQKSAAIFLLDGLGLVLQTSIGMLVLAFYHPALLALDAVLLAAALFVVVYLGRGGTASSVEESKAKYAVAAWLEEVARHPHALRATSGAAFAQEHADALTRSYLAARRAHFRLVYRQIVGSLWLQVAASAALLGVGGALVIGRQLTLGQLVAAEIIVTTVVASFAKLGKHLETWYDLLAAADKLGHLADLPLEARHGDADFDTDRRGAGVRLHDVTYRYPAGPAALEGLALTIAPGARVALTGPSGAGKTTLAALLFGLRLPSAGYLEVDGVDTREASPAELRERVAVLGQSLEVIDGTILDNVFAGRTGLTRRDAWEALERVGLAQKVRGLTEGLDTHVAASGAPLSHGEAQRLMVARAVAAHPRLLVVDGALGGLDASSRAVVEAALFDTAAPWTLVVLTTPDDPITRRADVVHPLQRMNSPEVA